MTIRGLALGFALAATACSAPAEPPADGQLPFAIGWFGLGLLAALVQLRATSSARKRRKSDDD